MWKVMLSSAGPISDGVRKKKEKKVSSRGDQNCQVPKAAIRTK